MLSSGASARAARLLGRTLHVIAIAAIGRALWYLAVEALVRGVFGGSPSPQPRERLVAVPGRPGLVPTSAAPAADLPAGVQAGAEPDTRPRPYARSVTTDESHEATEKSSRRSPM